MADPPPPPAIALRSPSKYTGSSQDAPPTAAAPPSLELLHRTWSVTHSTLAMWRDARNVRITYRALPPTADGRARIDDLVEYEARSGRGGVKTVAGVDTASGGAADTAAWDWRGKGWLFFVSSHWEVLGWGERQLPDGQTERWAVTWFAPTVFTKEGIDVYCDRREGLAADTEAGLIAALKALPVKALADMVERDLQPVEIALPWKQ